MKKLKMFALISSLICGLAFPALSHAVVIAQNDSPFLVTAGKITRPTTSPTSIIRYPNGGIKQMTWNYGAPIYNPSKFQPTITYMYKASSTPKVSFSPGLVTSIVVQKDQMNFDNYDITYNSAEILQSVTLTNNLWGNKSVWNYNSDGTLKSADVYSKTGVGYGSKLIQKEHVDYSYRKLANGGLQVIKADYVFNYNFVQAGPGLYLPVLAGKTLTTTITIYDAVGKVVYVTVNGVRQLGAKNQPAEALAINQKLDLMGQIISNTKSIPANVSVVSSVATKANQQNGPVPAKK